MSAKAGEIMELPKRKINRIPSYDYSQPNAYFITVCTMGRRKILWNNVGALIERPQDVPYSHYGSVVQQAVMDIPKHYPMVSVDNYVVMPNHVHILLQIHADADGRSMIAPTVATVVRQMKSAVTKKVGCAIWQKGFYDHVIRGEEDYQGVWNYIDGNPSKWREDELYRDKN